MNSKLSILTYGGKGYNLIRLKKYGFNVPDFFVIESDFFYNIINLDLTKKIDSFDIPEKYKKKIYILWKKISKNGKHPVAVRSSAIMEDSSNNSFAGLFDTYLNIRSFDSLLNSIIKTSLSIYNERVISYLKEKKYENKDFSIAIIVQRMIKSDVSGVIFTVNPLTANHNEIVISSTFGLGEGLVSGTVDADTFIMNKNGKLKSSNVVEKKESIIFDNEGTKRICNSEDIAKKSSLNNSNLRKLTKISLKIAKKFNFNADIEFAISNNKIYILQARPITTIKTRENILVWDNSNIVESYSGVTTPMTFTFIKKAYASVYKQFCELMGIDKNAIKNDNDIFNSMLGLIGGRVYYNLISWYKLVSFLPGYKYNKNFMEQMMGLSVVKDYVAIQKEESFFKKYFIYLPQTIIVALRMLYIFLTMKKRITKFFVYFYSHYNRYKEMDFSSMSLSELINTLDDLEEKILKKWKEPIINDLKCMIFYGILKKITINWGIDSNGILQNDLLAGEGNIKSKDVITELIAIAKEIRNKEKLNDFFLNKPIEETYNEILNNPEYRDIKERLKRYLYDYGIRSVEEMKLESIPVKDNPLFCINILKNYLSNPKFIDDYGITELKIRENAEKKVFQTLKNKRMFLFISKKSIYKFVLKNTREGIRDRENQRFCRSEIYGIVRDILKSIGKILEKNNEIEKKEDIFYLEWNELFDFIKDRSTTPDLKSLIDLRKKIYNEFKNQYYPDHIESEGIPYIWLKNQKFCRSSDNKILRGTGCSSGIVENRVIILEKPDINVKLNGEILVAKQTDPGWVVLFPSISGLIIEKGSVLSHSAIVAREMGIPTITGVTNATSILKNGDIIRLNGDLGEIEIL